MNFYFDIETIPCQLPGIREEFDACVQAPGQYKKAESIAEWMKENRAIEGEKAWLATSFDGTVGHTCVIGFAVGDEAPHSYQAATLDGETKMLQDFFCAVTDAEPGLTFVGHNIIGFDLPFLWKRAMILGVKPPRCFPRAPKAWSEGVADTMLLWDPTQRAGGSMDRICRFLGIPGKGDMRGSMVWPMYQEGRLTEIALYCKGDVERTRAMYKRMTFA
jgi:predicted PolB exonuclease-like 3'-5' exonuclease